MNDRRAPSTTSRDGLSFIHSSLDDAGLSPAEFRVYCHVNRVAGRAGVCHAALSTIAQHCGYCDEIARAALKRLTDLNMLLKNYIPGLGTEYRLTSPRQWKMNAPAPLGKNPRGRRKSQGTPTRNSQDYPYEKVVGKGILDEGSPIKVLQNESNKGNVAIKDLHPGLTELMADCREVFGSGEMNRSHCHRRWLERAQSEPLRLQRVLADVRESKRSRGVKNAGAYGEDLWKRWHEPAAKKSKESLKPSMITR